MYCYTFINQFACTFNELQLWSRISSEHPIFLKTVASLSKVDLPKAAEDKLNDIHEMFLDLYTKTIFLKKTVSGHPSLFERHIVNIKRLIDEFIFYDTQALSFYPQLLNFGTDNEAWTELVKHIISEQTFMLELFKDLQQQIS